MTVAKLGIESVLGTALVTVLTTHCITDVDADDESRAGFVILGKPTRELRANNVVSVWMQHPLGPNADTDAILSGYPRRTKDRPESYPAEFRGVVWKIVGAVQVNIRQKLPYSTAIAIIASLTERIKYAINTDTDLLPLSDDWGNTLIKLHTFEAAGYASGGGDTTINIKWISFKADIHQDRCRS